MVDLVADRAFLASCTCLGHLGGQLQLLPLEHLDKGLGVEEGGMRRIGEKVGDNEKRCREGGGE